MKKILFILLLLISGNVLSDDYANSFSEYRIQVKNAFGVRTDNSTWVSDTTMNDMIRQAVIAVGPIVRNKKETFSFLTVINQGAYDLDSTVLGLITVYYEKNDIIRTFSYAPKGHWREIFPKDEKKDYILEPSYYDYIDDKLFLYPTPPVNGDTIKYEAFTKVNSISALDSLSLIPQQYRTAVLDYVCYRVAVLRQHPLTDVYYRNYKESIAIINATLNRRGVPVETSTP